MIAHHWKSRGMLGTCQILLNKNPELRPIGIGEVLRRISRKGATMINKQDVMKAADSLQDCVAQEAGLKPLLMQFMTSSKIKIQRPFHLLMLRMHLMK